MDNRFFLVLDAEDEEDISFEILDDGTQIWYKNKLVHNSKGPP